MIYNNGQKWKWTVPNIDAIFLENYWIKSPEDFMKEPWGVEDLALLENEMLSLHFYQPHLVSFDTSLKSIVYNHNPAVKSKFDVLAKSIALQMKAVDIIIIEDWHYDEAFSFDDKLTVEIIRKGVKSRNFRFYEIDLNS